MAVPTFSRIEIRHDTPADMGNAATDLRKLADDLQRIGASVKDQSLMRLAAHDAIRKTSQKLRGKSK